MNINEHIALLWQMTIVCAVTLFVFYVVYAGFNRLKRQLSATHGIWHKAFIRSISTPLCVLVWISGLFFSFNVLQEKFQQWPIVASTHPFKRVILIVLVVWFMYRFVKDAKENALLGEGHRPPDVTTIHALAKLGYLAVVASGALFFLQLMGVPLSGVMALGGGSALVIGIAAKDLLANFFGGWVVIVDKPFKLGDYISSPDQTVEGTVEHIGWRSTRIRTPDKSALYVPNAIFTNISIQNTTRRLNRRILTVIGLRYSDIRVLPKIVTAIETMLSQHADIDQQCSTYTKLVRFGASTLDIELSTFTKTTDSLQFQAVQQDVLLRVAGIVAAEGAEMAFPTTTLDVPPIIIRKEEKAT